MGLNIEDISLALQNLFAQRQIATLYTQSNQYRIVLELDPTFTQGIDALGQTYIHNKSGEPILLSSVANIVQKRVPIILQQQSQFPANGVSFNLASGVALGDAIKAIDRVQQRLNLPTEVKVKLQGAAAAYESSQQHTFWLVIAAIVTMYIVLGHSVRKFYSPDNHSFYLALCCNWCFVGIVYGQSTIGHDCLDWDHFIDWSGQKKMAS